jgi:hypothetical protein
MKILLAGILGGTAMFIWTSIAHLVLPLGETGIQEIPNESAVLSAMQSNIGDQTGLYFFLVSDRRRKQYFEAGLRNCRCL